MSATDTVSIPYMESMHWFYRKYNAFITSATVLFNNCDMLTLLDRFEDSGFKLVSSYSNIDSPLHPAKHILRLHDGKNLHEHHWVGGGHVSYIVFTKISPWVTIAKTH